MEWQPRSDNYEILHITSSAENNIKMSQDSPLSSWNYISLENFYYNWQMFPPDMLQFEAYSIIWSLTLTV